MTTIPASWSVQAAIHSRLREDQALQTLLGVPMRLFDSVPGDAVHPFMTLGETRMRIISELEGAREHDIRLHAYSRWGGRREVKLLTDEVNRLLHDTTYPIEGHTVVQSRFIFADIFRRADPETYHATLRYRILTEPLPELVS